MLGLLPAMKQLCADLTESGLRAAIDLDRVNPPAVYVTLLRLDDVTLDGCCEAVLALYVCVADQSDEAALKQLVPMLATLIDTLDTLGLPSAIEPIEATRVVAPYATGADLPAFRVLTSLSV